jgi:hypothetical protein
VITVKKYLIIPVFLVFLFVCGWVNEVGMDEQDIICGELKRDMGECQPCLRIKGCDGEQYYLAVFRDPKCKFIKIVNPIWGDVRVHCGGEGDAMGREVRAHCITNYTSLECISSCDQCTDPCADVHCYQQCFGCDLWAMKCVDGRCVEDYIIEANSAECGCTEMECGAVCVGKDLWNQKYVNGECVIDQIIEHNSTACGVDLCANHCNNGIKDCGEYGVDCGGGCPFKDSDLDGIEDCKDLCPNSQCSRVDMNGCETDVDSDGVGDCEDECPHDKGDSSNRGCPSNILPLVAVIGGAAVAAGGVAIKGMKIAGEASKKAGTKTAGEASKKAGTKIAESFKKAGTKIAESFKKAGTKIAESFKKAGTKIAEAAIGAGFTGEAEKTQEQFIICPHCGEKLPLGSKFCSKCGHSI